MWSAGSASSQPRHDVQPYRIGAIGLSTGADVLIETTAAQANGEGMLSATVLDGQPLALPGTSLPWSGRRWTRSATCRCGSPSG